MTNYSMPAGAQSWPPPVVAVRPTFMWRAELTIFLIGAAYSTMIGGVMGIIWPRVAPHIDIYHAYFQGSVAASKPLLGDDVWFGFLGILAGVLCVAILLLTTKDVGRGPGALLGLVAGGILGGLVAAHVGNAIQQPHLIAGAKAQVPSVNQENLQRIVMFFTFKLRIHHMLLAWPMTVAFLIGLNTVIRSVRFPNER